jgi:hypothetical protein
MIETGMGLQHTYEDCKNFSVARTEGGVRLRWTTSQGAASTSTEIHLTTSSAMITAKVLHDFCNRLAESLLAAEDDN